MKVIIDAGHGGKDKGAEYYKICEKDLNLVIATITHFKLSLTNNTYMIRDNDTYFRLSERADITNATVSNGIFISIHCNAYKDKDVEGFEIWHYPSKKSETLAKHIDREMRDTLYYMKPRGLQCSRKLYVLRETECPAVLIECGFMSNKKELINLLNPKTQLDIAESIARGIYYYEQHAY